MSREDLQESVDKLREQIARLDPGEERRRLDRIVADLERQLERQDDDDDEGPVEALVENIGQAVGHFEVQHPRLTAALNKVMVTLSNIGV